jgi:hypothetical protein
MFVCIFFFIYIFGRRKLAVGAKVFKRVVFIFLFILLVALFLMVLPKEVSFWSLLDRTGEVWKLES